MRLRHTLAALAAAAAHGARPVFVLEEDIVADLEKQVPSPDVPEAEYATPDTYERPKIKPPPGPPDAVHWNPEESLRMLPAGYMPYEWGKGAAKVQLLLPESTSVLKYTQSDFVAEAEGDAAGTVGALTLRDSRWWGRLYVDGWPKALQYYRAHFGAPPPMGQMRVLVADPPTGCGNPYNFEHRNADGTAAAEDGEVEVGAAGGPETKEPNPEAEPEEPTGAFNTFDDYLKALPREFQGAPLDNAAAIDDRTIVVATRGECTYGAKARSAMLSGAAALVIVSEDDANDHLPAPDAAGLDFSVSTVHRDDGHALIAGLADATAGGLNTTARLVPINCVKSSKVRDDSDDSLCNAATAEERAWVKAPVVRGMLAARAVGGAAGGAPAPMTLGRYALGHFGTMPTAALREQGGVEMAVVETDACAPLGEAEAAAVRGKVAVVARGGCLFLPKAQHLHAAGAAAVVIANANDDDELIRPGAQPSWKARNVTLPVVLVSRATGDALAGVVAAARGGGAAASGDDSKAAKAKDKKAKKAASKKRRGKGGKGKGEAAEEEAVAGGGGGLVAVVRFEPDVRGA